MLAHFKCRAVGLVASLAMGTLAACSRHAPTALTGPPITPDLASANRVSLCHRTGSSGEIITVSPSAVTAHLKQGDYLTSLAVSHVSNQPNDGAHFRRIGDAIAAVRDGRLDRGELRSAACRITITVAAGPFRGSSIESPDKDVELFPLNVDAPDITLQGAFVMKLDASGRATGLGATDRETTLRPEPDVDDAIAIILANGHPGGSAGHGLIVEGFAMKGPARFAVFGSRVRRLVIRGNRFEGDFAATLDFRATSAVIARNQVRGTEGCDFCLAGPGVFLVTGNRLLSGGIDGILILPAFDPVFAAPFEVEPADLPAAAEVSADVANNEVRDHGQFPGGTGVRVAGTGIGASDVRGSTHVRIHDNRLVNNTFGVMIEAGFPEPDTRLRSDMDVVLGGNTIERTCQADLYVTFARHSGSAEPRDPFLKNSTYRLTLGGDVQFHDAWVTNPARIGNTLLVDGRKIEYGIHQPFDELTCPARKSAASSIAQSTGSIPPTY